MDGATFSATNVQESYSEDSLHSHAPIIITLALLVLSGIARHLTFSHWRFKILQTVWRFVSLMRESHPCLTTNWYFNIYIHKLRNDVYILFIKMQAASVANPLESEVSQFLQEIVSLGSEKEYAGTALSPDSFDYLVPASFTVETYYNAFGQGENNNPGATSVACIKPQGTGSGDVQLNPTCPLTTTTGAEEHTGVGSSAEEPHVSSAERELKKAHKA
ncbi:hypothetical protein YC2023_014432 [Brassica napus]